MGGMFDGASSFDQNLGNWHIVLDGDTISGATETLGIGAQNSWLSSRTGYGLGTGGNSDLFVVNATDKTLGLDPSDTHSNGTYLVNITSAGGLGDNNHRAYNVTVTGLDADAPTITINGANPLNFTAGIAYSDPGAACVDVADPDPTLSADDSNVDTQAAGTYEVTYTCTDSSDNTATTARTVHVTPVPEGSFVTTWNTTSAGETITIPVGGATGNYAVHWGDGSIDTHTSDAEHEYASAGSYKVSISGDFTKIQLGPDAINAGKLASIDQWGDTEWTTMQAAFQDASNMAYNATDAPDLSGVSSMRDMFLGASSFNADLSGWNVSSVEDMSRMFWDTAFDGNVSSWDVSSVTDMQNMFRETPFNGDISAWDVSSVASMSHMFDSAAAFNGNLSGWNVSSVATMGGMFANAAAFNADISGWNVSAASYMEGMFTGAASFRQNLGDWYVVLDSHSIDLASGTTIGTISPQNVWLANSQSGEYGIAETHDHEFFEISGTSLNVKDGADYTGKTGYAVNITSTHPFGANNHRLVDVTVTDTSTAFKTTWNTATSSEDITIPATGSYDIDWGDGTAESVTGPTTHTYADAGNHAVTVSGGLTRINLGADPDNAAKLVSIDQWGDMEWTTMEGAFQGASNMAYRAADAPDLSGVTNMTGMFNGSSAFDGNLSSWDVSGATNMSGMFWGAAAFDGDISSWNVSSVTDMDSMFSYASDFDGDITGWNVSSVTDMGFMFLFADAFDQDISGWDVSNVTDMEDLFFIFFPTFSHNLGKWHVTLDSTSIDLASGATTVGTISPQNSWLAENVGTYGIAGTHDHAFFEIVDGTKLGVKAGADYAGRTGYAVSITSTHPYGQNNHRVYNVTVTDSSATFVTTWETTGASQAITIPVDGATGNYTVHWGDGNSTTHVTDATHVYAEAGNHTVSISGDFTRIWLGGDAASAAKLKSIDQWGSIAWTTMEGAFREATSMVYNATDAPDLSGATSMQNMFRGAEKFDGDLSGWDVSGVANMNGTFRGARAFDGDLSAWDTSGANDTRKMFQEAVAFNGDISSWNTTGVVYMDSMFLGAEDFNSNISGWDVSSVTNMDSMFTTATSFNGDLSGWNVSGVTDMAGMFWNAPKFNADLSGWNVSSVTDMEGMFNSAASFNQDISGWNVSAVTNFGGMFQGATSFDQNLGAWYIVLNGTEIDAGDAPGVVGTISAQNPTLGNQATYGIGMGGDSTSFNITGGSSLNMNITSPAKPLYTVNITSTGDYGTNNHRAYNVTVTRFDTNSLPMVGAGADQEVVEGDTVTLSGTVTDVDTGDILTYSWTHDSDLPIAITGSDSLSASFVAPNVAENTTVHSHPDRKRRDRGRL